MYELVEATVGSIQQFIQYGSFLDEYAEQGDTSVSVEQTRFFRIGDYVKLAYSTDDDDFIEYNIIKCIDSENHIVELENPIQNIQWAAHWAMLCKCWITGVYHGNPPSIPVYPAITVELVNRDAEPLTLESFTNEYELEVTIWTNRDDYVSSHRQLLTITHMIEHALFIKVFPLISPIGVAYLEEEAAPSDTLIKVYSDEEDQLCAMGFVIIDDGNVRRQFHISENLGQGAFRLSTALGYNFKKDSAVIKPYRWVYNTATPNTSYGDAIDEATGMLLKTATITYVVQMETRRNKHAYY